jgi:hypothetical protein
VAFVRSSLAAAATFGAISPEAVLAQTTAPRRQRHPRLTMPPLGQSVSACQSRMSNGERTLGRLSEAGGGSKPNRPEALVIREPAAIAGTASCHAASLRRLCSEARHHHLVSGSMTKNSSSNKIRNRRYLIAANPAYPISQFTDIATLTIPPDRPDHYFDWPHRGDQAATSLPP